MRECTRFKFKICNHFIDVRIVIHTHTYSRPQSFMKSHFFKYFFLIVTAFFTTVFIATAQEKKYFFFNYIFPVSRKWKSTHDFKHETYVFSRK